jgi:hypothetical protein
MAQSFTEALYAMKRKAQLTGNPLTSRNINALTSGYIESATEMMNNQRAVDLQEEALAQTTAQNAAALAEAKRQAEESSSQSAIESANEIAAAEKASKNTLTGNLMNTGTSLVGTALMSEGGRALATDAVKGVGKLVSNAFTSSTAPTTAQATLTGAVAPAGEAATSSTGAAAGAQLTGATAAEGAATLSGAGTAAMSAAPYAVAGYLAAKYGGKLLTDVTGEHTVVGRLGKTISDPLQGVGRSLVNEFMPDSSAKNVVTTAMDILNPIGWAFKQLDCIIVTACTDRHSPEVEIAREYRDKFMSADQLRGYYMIAEAVMPWVVRHRAFVKKHFVDRLVEYGRYHLGHSEKMPCRASCAVTRGFLMLCGLAGRRKRFFVRCNGEAV